jgi:hypothetical protein
MAPLAAPVAASAFFLAACLVFLAVFFTTSVAPLTAPEAAAPVADAGAPVLTPAPPFTSAPPSCAIAGIASAPANNAALTTDRVRFILIDPPFEFQKLERLTTSAKTVPMSKRLMLLLQAIKYLSPGGAVLVQSRNGLQDHGNPLKIGMVSSYQKASKIVCK